MSTIDHRITVAIGEGNATRPGVLRFVLEGAGCDIAGTATNAADLGRVLALTRPDVVVLDDAIGIAATEVVRQMAPHAKVVLVWSPDIIPVGSDAAVDPSRVHRDLAAVVERVVRQGPRSRSRDVVNVPDSAVSDALAQAGERAS